jgi:Tol biopolymer transport system component/DNA-binding winged helix-turn-helix (wHTH) protein
LCDATRILKQVAVLYRWDDFVLDLDDFRLEHKGAPLALEPKAFNLLAFLVQRSGRLVTKQELFEAVWPDTAVTDHALTRVVAQLRRALGDEAREARYIETVPTRGYRWIRPITSGALAPSAPDAPGITGAPEAPEAPDAPDAPSAVDQIGPGSSRFIFRGAAVAFAVVVGALAVLLWSQRGETTAASEDRHAMGDAGKHDLKWPVQVTTRSGLELQPALSPAGDAIAYVSDRTGTLEIYVRALHGTAVDTPLTADGQQNVQPAWSPDGRFIAYHSYSQGGVWVVPARGGVPRQLAPQGSNPVWAPDGRRVAFQSDEHADVTPSAWGAQAGSTLWVVDADGTQPKPLTTGGHPIGGHAAPAWSRSGRYIAFAVFEGALQNGVWLLDVRTGDIRQLIRGPGLYELVFAPDDSAIYIAGGHAFIVRLPFDPTTGTAAGERQLIPIAGVPGVRGLSISTDGTTLAFAGLALSSQIWAQRVRADGTRDGEAYAVTSDTSRRNSLASMSPDGSKIVYMSTRGGAPPDVWLMNADGSNQMTLTADDSSDGKPTWFADSKRIAYLSNRQETLGLWAVDIATRRHELLFDHGRLGDAGRRRDIAGSLAELQISPSMTRIAFSVIAPPSGRRRLYVATLSPFEARPLTDGTESVGYPAWSPDERRLAVEVKDGSSTYAGVVDVDTGVVRRLTAERGQSWVRSWSPDSRRIAMAVLRGGVWSLRWVDVETGREETILPPLPPHMYVRYPEWSPRGDVVVFERGELRGNIWTLPLE